MRAENSERREEKSKSPARGRVKGLKLQDEKPGTDWKKKAALSKRRNKNSLGNSSKSGERRIFLGLMGK